MSNLILSLLVAAVIAGNTPKAEAIAEYIGASKGKAKAAKMAEFETALTAAMAEKPKRKPRRVKVAAPVAKATPIGTVTLPSNEKQGVYRLRAMWLDHCGKESIRKGYKVAPGMQTPFEAAVESAGVNGNNGGRCAYYVFRHYVRTGQMLSEVDCYDLMRTGGRQWLGHFRKLEKFVKSLVANK